MKFDELIQKQTDYFRTHESKNVDFRIAQLRKLKKLLLENESRLYEAVFNDFKKSKFDTYASELVFVHHELDTAIRQLPRWAKRKRKLTNIINLPGSSFVIPEPLGVCLVMGAWNYPYMLSLIPLISAMGAGNTVILKPSEIPAATSAVMAQIINSNFDPAYVCVVEGGVQESTDLLSQRFDKIFFTGSTAVGRIVYEAAAKHLTPVTLELGGKSPVIVTSQTNLKEAVKRITWAKFLNAGQTCIAPDYILVEEKIKDDFLALMKAQIETFDYAFKNDNYVQIINDKNFNRLIALLGKNKIHTGGNTDAQQRYISPTVLMDVSFDDEVMQNEIFGPILPVISYTHLEEVVTEINRRPKPLACYIFTQDRQLRDRLLNEISFGGGAINDTLMQISNPHLPFGGVGESGFGNYHGKNGFAAFSHDKGIVSKPFWLETKLKYPPYSNMKLAWIRRLMKL